MENLLSFFDSIPSMVWGLITGAVIMLPILFLLLCYYVLAPRNIFFTFGRENRAMFVMTGKKFSGKVILPSQTLFVDETDNYEIKSFKKFPNHPRQKSLLGSGMYWIGFFPFRSIYERRQQWLEWQSNDKGKREIRVRDEMTPFLIVKPFEYTMLLEEGEDKNQVPLNVYFTVILMPINARKPIFENDNAYGQVQTLCRTEVLLFVRERTFSNIGGDNTSSKIIKDGFSSEICQLNKEIPGRPDKMGIKKVLGYEILDAKLDVIELAGDYKDKLLEASTAKYIAGEKAKATIAEADGKFQATQFEARGKKAIFDVQKEYLKDISGTPGAMKVEERKATPGLTTLVEGDGDKKTSLIIGGK